MEGEVKVGEGGGVEELVEVFMEGGVGQVWSADGVRRLREEHRVVGSLVGSSPRHPATLPLILMAEEVQLLKEKRLASVVEVAWGEGREERRSRAEEHREQSYQEQVEEWRKERKGVIVKMADKIVEGKRRKLEERRRVDGGDVEEVDKEATIRQEVAKIKPITRDMAAVQLFVADPWIREQDKVASSWTFPFTSVLVRTRLFVYKDLWNHGYYLTDGTKFGGDFLAYLGDPVIFHARYIVVCREGAGGQKGRPQDLVALSRLGTCVRKVVLLAWLEGEEVRYKSVRRGAAREGQP